MNPGRFFLPNFSTQMAPLMRASYLPSRMGLFGRITNSIRRFNWSGLLNGANKTLNVVNQTIPLVRQAGPMVSNMKNMFKIAKAFGNETNTSRIVNSTNNIRQDNSSKEVVETIQNKTSIDNNYPSFFV